MAKKKKEKVTEETEHIEYFVKDLEDLRQHVCGGIKLNPMEKAMAIKLLMDGTDFFLQHRIDVPNGWEIGGRTYFIADFFLPEIKLVVETDGKIHGSDINKEKDRNKDNCLASLGYRVMRFNWDDVMDNNENFDVISFIWKLQSVDGVMKF